MTIIVSPMSHLPQLIAARRPSHLLTLVSPDTPTQIHPGIPMDRHLVLRFHDLPVAMAGYVAPGRDTIAAILDFAATWDRQAPFLIHCLAGVSRSTAAAYILRCRWSAPGQEADIAHALRAASPYANPNRMMIDLADTLMKRERRMINAITAMGLGSPCAEAPPFELSL